MLRKGRPKEDRVAGSGCRRQVLSWGDGDGRTERRRGAPMGATESGTEPIKSRAAKQKPASVVGRVCGRERRAGD